MRSSLVVWRRRSADSRRWLFLLMTMLVVSVGVSGPGVAQAGRAAARKVATPVITPPGGTFTAPRSVAIATTTPSATVYYTIDGSTPTTSSPRYSGAFIVSTTTTVRAIAVRNNWTPSNVASATIAMNFGTLSSPVMSPPPGIYHAFVSLTLSAQSGATIRYTLDGTAPTESAAPYTAPVTLTTTTNVRARAFRRDYTPSTETQGAFTIQPDVTPPTILPVFSMAPNSAGWFRGPVTVGFGCSDTESAIVSCSAPVHVSTEGRVVLDARAVDAAGNSAVVQVPVNVDLTAPVLTISSPPPEVPLPASTTSVTIRGVVQDTSGLSTLTCAGVPGSVSEGAFSCTVPVTTGTNVIPISAFDLAGHPASLTLQLVVSEPGGPPTSIEISPESLLMFVGQTRGLAVTDDRGRLVSGGTWSFSAPIAEVAQRPGTCQPGGAVACLEPAELTILRATAPGEVTVTVTYLGLTTSSTISILQAGTVQAPGTTMWTLSGGSAAAPLRAQVIPAAPQVDGDPERDAGLFFVDEARQWFGTRLVPIAGAKLEIRTTTADGRELWRMRDTDPATLKFGALADARGGIIVVTENGFDDVTQTFFPDKVRRFDGRTGAVTWQYIPEWFYTLSEPAVHPDGTVYFTEEAGVSTDPPSHLVGVAPDGTVSKWSLPTGTFTRHDAGTGQLEVDHRPSPALAGQPIVRDDDTVVLVAKTLESTQYVISSYNPDGTLTSRSDPAHTAEFIYSGWVIELAAGGELRSYQVSRGASLWATFRPQDWKLLPDGEGGLLVGHRSQRTLLHFDAARQVSSGVLATGSGTTFGMEYVLGDDGAYALEHGGFGGTFWTRTYRFNPVTLAVSASTFVTSNQPVPSNLRLQFATAGGGVYLSGPTVSPTFGSSGGALALSAATTSTVTNATQIAEGVWAGWGTGPTLMTADSIAASVSAWPRPQGTIAAANVAVNPGFGIFVKSHSVFLSWSHTSLRIVPKNQAFWLQRMPKAFENVDSEGRHFATLGAGPPTGADSSTACDGSLTLVSNTSRPLDISEQAQRIERLLSRVHSTEDETIQALFDLDAAYDDGLPYCFWPTDSSASYNSNSYISGLLRTAFVPPPFVPRLVPILYPGWSKPVPSASFTRP